MADAPNQVLQGIVCRLFFHHHHHGDNPVLSFLVFAEYLSHLILLVGIWVSSLKRANCMLSAPNIVHSFDR